MPQVIQTLINAWQIDIWGGWSLYDIGMISALLFVVAEVINYFFFKADTK